MFCIAKYSKPLANKFSIRHLIYYILAVCNYFNYGEDPYRLWRRHHLFYCNFSHFMLQLFILFVCCSAQEESLFCVLISILLFTYEYMDALVMAACGWNPGVFHMPKFVLIIFVPISLLFMSGTNVHRRDLTKAFEGNSWNYESGTVLLARMSLITFELLIAITSA